MEWYYELAIYIVAILAGIVGGISLGKAILMIMKRSKK